MPRELWEKVLREVGEKKMAGIVFFSLLGEPFLHEDIFDAIRFANNLDLSVSLYTNGALLDEEKGDKLLDSLRKGRIILSLQEIFSGNFEKRCKGSLSWESYIDRLQKFMIKAHSRGKSVEVDCMVDMLSMGWNFKKIRQEQQMIQNFYDKWAEVLGSKKRQKINILNPAVIYPFAEHSSFLVKHRNRWSNQLIDEDTQVEQSDKGYCLDMSHTFAVLADGTCTFCCGDYEGKLNLGNARDACLEDIFYGEKATRIREAGNDGKMVEDICKTCRGRLVYKKNKKSVPNRNLLSEFFFLLEHFKCCGLASTFRKVAENIRRRLMR